MKTHKKENIKKRDLPVVVYLFCMLFLLPLVLDDGYINYMATKYTFFRNASILGIVVIFIFYPLKAILWKKFLLKKQNICLMCFLVVSVISTIASANPYKSFIGQQGRFCGLLLFLLLAVGLVIVVSYGRIREFFLYFIGASVSIISILNVLNHFNIDPLGVYTNLAESDWYRFSSTLGNIDNVGEYLSVVYVFCATYYCIKEGKTNEKKIHWFVLALCALAIVVNGTDGSYIGIILFVVLYPILIDSLKQLSRYLIVLETFFGACAGREVISLFWRNEKQQDSISNIFRNNMLELCIIIAIFLLAIILCQYLMGKDIVVSTRKWHRIYFILLVSGGILGIIFVLGMNIGWINVSNATINNLFVFSDSWGTNRGYIFKEVWNSYLQLPVFQKLFGIGPAMLYPWSLEHMDLIYMGVAQISNAHNMYLQILLTHGLLGLIFWMGWLIFSLWEGIKRSRVDKRYLCLVAAIVSYCTTMIIGLNMLVVTVTCFLLCCFMQCEFE